MLKKIFMPAVLSFSLIGCGGPEDDYNNWQKRNPDLTLSDYIQFNLAYNRDHNYDFYSYRTTSSVEYGCDIGLDGELDCGTSIEEEERENTPEETAADNARYEARGEANKVVHLLATKAAFVEGGHVTPYSISIFNQHAADLAIQAVGNNNRLAVTDPDNNIYNNADIKLPEGTAYETAVQLVKEANQKNVGADIIVSFVPLTP